MKAPKQRTAILAASLALLVSGGVALQTFAETPVGLRDTQQAYGATAAGAGALSDVASGWEAYSATLPAVDALDAGRFTASVPAAAPDFSRLVGVFGPSTGAEAAFAAHGATDALWGALRAGGAERTLFASEVDISPGFDLSSMVAAFGASDGRFSFSQAEAADQLLAALRSTGAESSPFAAPAEAAAPDMSAMAARTTRAFAAQTTDGAALRDALRADPDDASSFSSADASRPLSGGLADVVAAFGPDRAGTATFAGEADGGEEEEELQTIAGGMIDRALAAASDPSGFQDAMRAGGEDSSLFAREVTGGSATLLDIDALAAALSSDSMEQGEFAARDDHGWRSAMQADDTSSGVFSGAVTSSTPSIDFAAIGAALSGEE